MRSENDEVPAAVCPPGLPPAPRRTARSGLAADEQAHQGGGLFPGTAGILAGSFRELRPLAL